MPIKHRLLAQALITALGLGTTLALTAPWCHAQNKSKSSTAKTRPSVVSKAPSTDIDEQAIGTETGPVFLSDIKKDLESKSLRRSRSLAATREGGAVSETGETVPVPVGTQISFFELAPSAGAINIRGNTSFTTGLLSSFRFAESIPLYLEPSLLVSFLSGDNDRNATLFHFDAGLRYDFVIPQSAVIPFVKAAVGPSVSSDSNVTVDGDNIGGSYFNLFAGGGLKVLASPHIAARFDTGLSLQSADTGLYLTGSVVLPL